MSILPINTAKTIIIRPVTLSIELSTTVSHGAANNADREKQYSHCGNHFFSKNSLD
jgi:hypothetical protein